MTFSEEGYWESREMSAKQERENEEIVKNIEENLQAEEKAFQQSVEEQTKSIEAWSQEQKTLEVSQTNTSNLDPLDEQEVFNVLVNYKNAFVDAINNSDFSHLEPYLLPNSNFYFSQEELVNKGISEHLYSYNIEFVQQVNDNEFEVGTYEEVGIESDGNEDVKVFQWVYTVEELNGNYLLSDRKSR